MANCWKKNCFLEHVHWLYGEWGWPGENIPDRLKLTHRLFLNFQSCVCMSSSFLSHSWGASRFYPWDCGQNWMFGLENFKEFFQGKLLVILLLRKFNASVCFVYRVVKHAWKATFFFSHCVQSPEASKSYCSPARDWLPTRSSLETADILPFTGGNTGWKCVLPCGLNKRGSI